MTKLSVNLNKIALLRNSRGRDYPNVPDFARRFIDLGTDGITIHPRQDERHARRQDAHELGRLCTRFPGIEFNIEGYPSEAFIAMMEIIRPDQCTLVPDDAEQLTSDHGWDIVNERDFLRPILDRLRAAGVRSSLFVDPDAGQVQAAADIGTDRIELYTELYASHYHTDRREEILERYREAAAVARDADLGVNAGHDLNLRNLKRFLEIGDVLEVSIGHALTVECLERGMADVINAYLAICHG